MHDYLSDLVSKNGGTAVVLEPRRRARFEPADPLLPFESESGPSFQKETVERQEFTELPPPLRQPRRRGLKRAEETSPAPLREASNQTFDHETPPVVSRPETQWSDSPPERPRPALSPKLIEAPPETTTEITPVSAPLSPPTSTPLAPGAPKTADKREKSDAPSERSSTVTPSLLPPKGDAVDAPPVNDSEQKAIETRERIVIEPRVEKIESRVTESKIQPALTLSPEKQSAEQVAERAKTAETTIINVTIGRVEVRAAVSSGPPKQAPSKRPTLSLDEYLRNRGAGGRK